MGGRFLPSIATAILLGIGLSATTIDAVAQSRVCRNLQQQYNQSSKSGGSQARKLERAIARQSAELAKVRGQLGRARCGLLFFAPNTAQCGALRKSAQSMERNIARMKGQLASAPANRLSRRQILASLQANGCNSNRRSTRVARTGKPEQKAAAPSGGAIYRTMCVRSCDGYYFPISFSVTKDMFGRDQQTCEQRCPGSEASLFAYNVKAEETEDMISVAGGTPYRDLPNAFRYRRNGRNAACSCQSAARNFSVVAGNTPPLPAETDVSEEVAATETEQAVPNLSAAETTSFYVARPSSPDSGIADKEVAATDTVDATAVSGSVGIEDPAPRRIRIVGPMFLPDPEEAIDLKAPARIRAP